MDRFDDLIWFGKGAAAAVQSIIMLLKYDTVVTTNKQTNKKDLMAPPKHKYFSSAARRKLKKTKTESRRESLDFLLGKQKIKLQLLFFVKFDDLSAAYLSRSEVVFLNESQFITLYHFIYCDNVLATLWLYNIKGLSC